MLHTYPIGQESVSYAYDTSADIAMARPTRIIEGEQLIERYTYLGLGTIKRLSLQGKNNILIVAPDTKIASDWIDAGVNLGLKITPLAFGVGRRIPIVQRYTS